MANSTSGKKMKRSAMPQMNAAKTEANTRPISPKGASSGSIGRTKISLQDARRGIILSEILGKPISGRRVQSRWR